MKQQQVLAVDIADKLSMKLEQKGWSQKYLASKSGIGQPQISRILRRESQSPNLDTLRAFARALDCTVVDLLADTDKQRPSQSREAA